MLTVLTNIPTPYRTAFFNSLNAELKNDGIDFHVIYCAKTEPRRFWEFTPDDNKYSYTFLRGFHPKFKNFYPHFNFGLTKLLKSINPKYILMAGAWNAPSVVNVCLNKQKINAKLIFWSEGHFDAQRNKNQYVDKVRAYIFSKMDAFVVPNNKSKVYIENYNDKVPIGLLPNTVDESFFNTENLPQRNELRERLNLPFNKKIVLVVSTLSERKGVFEMIQAYCLLNEVEKSKLMLIFLGTGDLWQRLNLFKQENELKNILILGQKSTHEVRDYLHISDIFALPTKLDPNPLTPIEAGFMRKPLLLSRLAGNHNELIRNDTGFSFETISPEVISQQLKKVISLSKRELENMGQRSFENVTKNFSRKGASNSLIDFIKQYL